MLANFPPLGASQDHTWGGIYSGLLIADCPLARTTELGSWRRPFQHHRGNYPAEKRNQSARNDRNEGRGPFQPSSASSVFCSGSARRGGLRSSLAAGRGASAC